MPAIKILMYLVLVINGIGFMAMLIDKSKAVFNAYRIPEKFFLRVAFATGGIGIILGMLVFRHKIRKTLFTVWIPLVTVALWVVMGFVVYQLKWIG